MSAVAFTKSAGSSLLLPTAQPDDEKAFPPSNPTWEATGQTVLFQKKKASNDFGDLGFKSVIRTDNEVQFAQSTETVCKVLEIGPMAFRNPKTGELYPGAPWYRVGDIVRVRMYNFETWTEGGIDYLIADYLEVRARKRQAPFVMTDNFPVQPQEGD